MREPTGLTAQTIFPLTTIRIRQARTSNKKEVRDSCGCPKLRKISPSCHWKAGEAAWETRHFSASWQRPRRSEITHQRPTPFTHIPGSENTLDMRDYKYPGHGYDQILSSQEGNFIKHVIHLRDSDWLDNYTQIVRLDFVVYNENTKMVTTVTEVYEFTQIGIFRSILTDTGLLMTLLSDLDNLGNPKFIFLVIFATFMIVDIFLEFLALYRLGIRRYLTLSRLVIFLQLALSLAMLLLSIYKEKLTEDLLEQIREDRFNLKTDETYVNFRSRVKLDKWFHLAESSLIVLLLGRLAVISKEYRFPNRAVQTVIRLKNALIFPFATLFLASLLGYMLFPEVEGFYKLFPDSIFTVVLLMFRPKLDENKELIALYPKSGLWYICMVGALMEIFVINTFIIQFIDSYDRAKCAEREEVRDP